MEENLNISKNNKIHSIYKLTNKEYIKTGQHKTHKDIYEMLSRDKGF